MAPLFKYTRDVSKKKVDKVCARNSTDIFSENWNNIKEKTGKGKTNLSQLNKMRRSCIRYD